MSPTPVSLKGRALRLLSQRDHTRAELVRKLSPLEEQEGDLAQVLDELTAKGFISEDRVIESHLNRRAGKLGAARLRQELIDKGVSVQAIQTAIQDLEHSELDRAREVWARKFDQPAKEPKERARQMRFLLARGFSAAVVKRVLDQAQKSITKGPASGESLDHY